MSDSLMRNTLVVLIISGLAVILSYAFRVYLSRNFSVEDYGFIYAAIAFFSIILIVVDLGLTQAVVNLINKLKAKKKYEDVASVLKTTLFMQLSFTLVFSLILLLLHKQISHVFFSGGYERAFWAFILWFFTYPFYALLINYMMSEQKTTWYAGLDFSRTTILLAGSIALAAAIGFAGVLVMYASIHIVIFLFTSALNPSLPLIFRAPLKFRLLFPETIKYGLFVTVSTMSWVLITQSDTLTVSIMLGIKQAGIYQAAVPIAALTMMVMNAFSLVLFPKISSLWVRKQKRKIAQHLRQAWTYLLILAVPLIAIIIAFNDLIILTVFGDAYSAASAPLRILVVAFLFLSTTMVISAILSAIGLAKKTALIVLTISACNVVGNILLVKILGLAGVALSTLLSSLLLFIILSRLLAKHIHLSVDTPAVFKIIVASAVMLGLLYLLKYLLRLQPLVEVAICIVIAGSAYLSLLSMTKVITKKEIMGLLRS